MLKRYCAGDRPIPSKTGGGDLDGDPVSDSAYNIPVASLTQVQYHIASLEVLPIGKLHPAAAYTQAPKRLLDRKCNMDDVADFVTDYITSEVSISFAKNVLFGRDFVGLGSHRNQLADYCGSKQQGRLRQGLHEVGATTQRRG